MITLNFDITFMEIELVVKFGITQYFENNYGFPKKWHPLHYLRDYNNINKTSRRSNLFLLFVTAENYPELFSRISSFLFIRITRKSKIDI